MDFKKANSITMRAAAVLLILVLLSCSIVSGRYARYTTAATSKDSARVAAFVFDVADDNSHYVDLTGIRKPGDIKTYQFTVRNHNGSAVSEVAEEFFLSLELRGNLPLVCTLTSAADAAIELQGTDIDSSTGLTAGSGSLHTFSAAVQSGIDYTLTVAWPSNENHLKYAQAGLAELVLTVAAQQMD